MNTKAQILRRAIIEMDRAFPELCKGSRMWDE